VQTHAPARRSGLPLESAQPALRRAEIRHALTGPRLQPKLEVGAPDDAYEREAERVAAEVMQGPAPEASEVAAAPPRVQRACSCGGTCDDCREDEKLRRAPERNGTAPAEAPRSVREALHSPGRPLDGATRAFFEPRFGRDLGGVRVHTGPEAAASAREVSALAYTVGSDIVFGSGRYAPGTEAGRSLLAHELVHTVQQGAGLADRVQRRWGKPKAGECDDVKGKTLNRVVVEQETPQSVTLHWSDGSIESGICSTGKGHCCADPATPEAATCSAERSRKKDTNCTPITEDTGYTIQHRDRDHSGIDFWSEFVPSRAIALHEYEKHGTVDGTPLSHGCVRLSMETARKIFCGAVQNKTLVQVRGFARPKCDDPDLQAEWQGDFETAGGKPDGEGVGEARKMLRDSLGLKNDKELLEVIKKLELPEPFTLLDPKEEAKVLARVEAKIPRCKDTGPLPTVEEARGMSPVAPGGSAVPMKILAASNFDELVVPFQAALKGAGDAAKAEKVVGEHGRKLWEKSVKRAQGASADLDDRPLYWARLDMARALRQWQPTAFALSTAKREDLLAAFERASRGMEGAAFDSTAKNKRVVVSGFDPFGLESDVGRSNPSGAAVLSLDGQTISGGGVDARIEGVIFPVRFADFNAGMVETFFRPYLAGKTAANMIVTISQGRSDFDIEKWAGRRRSTKAPDNLEAFAGGTSNKPVEPKGLGAGPEFLETSLPVKEMQKGTGKSKVNFNENLTEQVSGTNKEVTKPTSGSTAVEGSGGGYLSNEIFYRTALLRSDMGSTVPYGHLHTPIPGAVTRDAIVAQVREILKSALPAI